MAKNKNNEAYQQYLQSQGLAPIDTTRGKQLYGDATSVRHALEGWHVIAQYKSASSSSIHSVEADGTGQFPTGYRCTCQGYKIHGKKQEKLGGQATCKHTQQAHSDGLK